MKWLLLVMLLVAALAPRARADDAPAMTPAQPAAEGEVAATEAAPAVVDFEADGVLVALPGFFHAAKEAVAAAAVEGQEPAYHQPEVACRAFVTADGAYAFLESPENAQQLAGLVPGSGFRIKGKMLVSGALLHVDHVQKLELGPDVKADVVAADPGVEAELTGVNKCQCGLSVDALPHSCKLGHLHHLQAEDGKIYHYLQVGPGGKAFAGDGSHFKPLKVTALVLPGHFLLVRSAEVQ